MKGIWLSKAEIVALPTTGAAWDTVKAAADKAVTVGTDILSYQDSPVNVAILAKALVFARTGEQPYLVSVLGALRAIANGLPLGRSLALGRELAAYVISADLVDLLTVDPGLDAKFSAKIKSILTEPTSAGGPKNLLACQDERPNNWGSHARASITAVGLYLGDTAIVNRSAQVFKGWLGDPTSYASFTYGALDWQADASAPVGINPSGATKQGHSIDGGQPEELRRPTATAFSWPPSNAAQQMYTWEALQGAFLQAQLLYRNGFPDVYAWCDQALLRAVKFAYGLNWPATGDDGWQPWLINAAYGTTYAADPKASPGKNMGWTQWTHAEPVIKPPPPPPPPPPVDNPDVATALLHLRTAQSSLTNIVANLTTDLDLVAAAIKALGG